MIILDVNVVIASFRTDHPHHDIANPWLSRLLGSTDQVVVADLVWVGFLRIVTHPSAFREPSTLAEAAAFVQDVIGAPAYQSSPPTVAVASRLVSLCRESQAIGNLVPDAYLASLALSYNCPVASFDKDFRRFDGLEIVTPS